MKHEAYGQLADNKLDNLEEMNILETYCCCSVTKSCLTLWNPWTTTHEASLFLTISWSLPKFMPIESVMQFNHLILCHPVLLLPSIFPSIRIFSSEPAVPIKWPNYWSFNFSISPSKEHSGLIFFKIDWLYPLAFQGTLKSLTNTTVWKHQFLGALPSLLSSSHICTWLLERP